MEFMPYNNAVFHPGFDYRNRIQQPHTYPQYPEQHPHRPYAVPRRSNSMTDLSQMAKASHGEKGDTKPRLTKGEVETLERQFQEQHKPSSNTKRQLAERMGVDIARINNWFQNRRAKAKQEQKQIEFGLREAGTLAYSEPSSPEHFNPTGYFDSPFRPSDHHLISFPPGNGGSAPIATYHPHYENPAAASLNSLQRTLVVAEAAVSRGEFDGEYQDQPSTEQFNGPISFDGYPVADRAQFPVTNPQTLSGFEYNGEVFEQHVAQPAMLHEPQAPQGFACYIPEPEEQHVIQANVPTFPSQLLAGHCEQDRTPRPFQTQNFEEVAEGPSFQSPPSSVESSFRSPPPPANIAGRRSKPRPAALGTSALRDKTSTGPKTANNTESVKRLHGSPSTALRRVSSASGLNVLAGRVQKSSQMPLRSPLKRNFTTGTPSSAEQPHIKMPMRNRAWLATPRGPPTPRSPRELLLTQGLVLQDESVHHDDGSQRGGNTPPDQHTPSESSQSESDGSYMFERTIPGCFTVHGLMSNMASPPETPGNPNSFMQWGYEVPDDALLTPGFGSFDSMMQAQPHYVSPVSASQPPTPAFGAQFNGFPFANHSPVFEMVPAMDSGATEYCFPEPVLQYPMVASTKESPEQPREKTYTFNNATQKDFESS